MELGPLRKNGPLRRQFIDMTQVANRHNYILWLKKLTDTACYAPRRELVGLDIGTGASCIYPLLGCSQRPWSFIATGTYV